VKDRIPPSMNTRSKSSLPTATTPHLRLHQCRPVTDYSCHRPRCHRDRAVLRGHPPPRGACQDRLRQRRGPIPPGLVATAHLPPACAARTPNPDDCGRPSSGHTERSDLRPT
jgi:hypothetical protein